MDDCTIRTARNLNGEHYRDADVEDVAREVIRAARLFRSRIGLFVHPNNTAEICIESGRTFGSLVRRAPASLVGVYDELAGIAQIVEDVLAMPRCEEFGR